MRWWDGSWAQGGGWGEASADGGCASAKAAGEATSAQGNNGCRPAGGGAGRNAGNAGAESRASFGLLDKFVRLLKLAVLVKPSSGLPERGNGAGAVPVMLQAPLS